MAFKPALAVLLLTVGYVSGFGNDRLLLRDVSALTLHTGRMTAGRRSAAVPQLRCVGGCSSFTPDVVQCLNRGHDGVDVQWECKADMDSSYRFGSISVSCEGYDYPDDPYVLRGSCGLEYSLVGGGGGGGAGTGGWRSNNPLPDGKGNGSGVLIILVLIGVAFGVYKLFLSGGGTGGQGVPYPPADDVHQQHAAGLGTGPAYPPPPPPYSFKDQNPNSGSTAGSSPPPSYGWAAPGEPRMRRPPGAEQSATGPGFWSGMGAGGLMGYLLGSRNSGPTYHHQPAHNPSWFGSSSSSSSRSVPNFSGGGGTRPASGFGGTTRR
ncbi:store-operated calcium entry-associated regulatory factor [Lethenteron reissneri]|uniref:store-operated calcium entry-associated regulatory factor n=1 Tax=Lethenteron reissneri TaxID=7753 RepID=UPI002AB78A3B|nr:store-operated calcium entry-associated regulatory factor [Lethenteron reissneri]XP_061419633.1 store-operated calcium entry-associated regulatory factor [Lethenteron reissneri]XP_061419639.1 store-operated calcium entry-associated regulatory factor [Lethenteron reissneri]